MARKASLGADLVIPLLALGFAAYFFWSIADLAWEAKANGVVIGAALVVLVSIQIAAIAVQVAKGTADFGAAALWRPRDVLVKRIGMVLVTVAFIAALPLLGLTLSLAVAMAAALILMGVRSLWTVLWISLAVAAAACILFIVILDAAFPHGPIEKLLT